MGKKSRKAKKKPLPMPLRAASASTHEENNGKCMCIWCDGTTRTWVAGRGGKKTKNERRDKFRMNKARALSLEQVVTNNKASVQDFVQSLSGLEPEQVQNVVEYVERARDLMLDQHDAILKEICEIDEPKGKWHTIEAKTTRIIEDFETIRSETKLDKKECLSLGLVLPSERIAYYNRAQARFRGAAPTWNLRGAVEDLAEALAIHQALYYSEEIGDQTNVKILYLRGKCLMELKDMGAAIVDFEAAHSAIRVIGDSWNGTKTLPMDVVKHLLMAKAIQKQNSGQPRPLYSKQERDSIERDLGLNAYYFEKYHCQECGSTPSNVKLCLCSRCQKVWYCSKKCQNASWKKGHQHDCIRPLGITLCLDEDRAFMLKILKEMGGATFIHSNFNPGQPCALLRDHDTGRLFEALADEDVLFLPSESNAYIKAFMANPADETEGKFLTKFMAQENLKSLTASEARRLIDLRRVFEAIDRKDAVSAEKKATALWSPREKIFPCQRRYCWSVLSFQPSFPLVHTCIALGAVVKTASSNWHWTMHPLVSRRWKHW